jgi:predicted MPP superfamily phosphohydrolase
VVLVAIAMLVRGYLNAIEAPVIRQALVRLNDWPAGAAPVKILFASDFHVAGPDMPPSRLRAIVDRANAMHPDLVILGGDFTSDKLVSTRGYSTAEAIAPLAGLRARLGILAVLGNHDHLRGIAAARDALRRAGIRVLDNEAVTLGPIMVGGLDDFGATWDDAVRAERRLYARMRAMPGAALVVAHSPDQFPRMPATIGLMLAGHTHCGQIVLPLVGALATGSSYGDLYRCGLVAERGRLLIVTAGLGTSHVPIRLGTVPDMWLVTVTGH